MPAATTSADKAIHIYRCCDKKRAMGRSSLDVAGIKKVPLHLMMKAIKAQYDGAQFAAYVDALFCELWARA